MPDACSRRPAAALRKGLVGTLLVVTTLLAGCGVTWDAPKVGLTVREDDIVYTQVDGPAQLVGGETVLQVANASNQPRRIVVAHVPEGDVIPEGVLEAASAREDARIVGYSRELEPQRRTTGEGGFRQQTDSASFHIHLRRDERYVVFDALTAPDGPTVWIQPGEGGDQLAGGG